LTGAHLGRPHLSLPVLPLLVPGAAAPLLPSQPHPASCMPTCQPGETPGGHLTTPPNAASACLSTRQLSTSCCSSDELGARGSHGSSQQQLGTGTRGSGLGRVDKAGAIISVGSTDTTQAVLKARSDASVLKDLRLGTLLGQGCFGRVYRGGYTARQHARVRNWGRVELALVLLLRNALGNKLNWCSLGLLVT
jgi:hypothetical protein